jgi:pimeloyl-ACP methyl ester carboxylesterase
MRPGRPVRPRVRSITGKEFVLVPGISHGAWCWEPLCERLRRRGHRAIAVELPGHGRRAAEHGRASLTTYARAVVDSMALEGISRAIMVGHSIAGVIVARAVELAPARVASVALMSAVVLPDRETLASHFTPTMWQMTRGLASACGNGTYRYPAELVLTRWLSDLPPGSPAAQRAIEQFTPQAVRIWTEKVRLERFYAMTIPRVYIRCLRDPAFPPDLSLKYASRLGVTPIDVDAGHDAMLSAPDALAAILEKL